MFQNRKGYCHQWRQINKQINRASCDWLENKISFFGILLGFFCDAKTISFRFHFEDIIDPQYMCHCEQGMPSPLCTGNTGALVVKAHWTLVMALQLPAVWLLRAGKQLLAVSRQWPLPGMWYHTHHTEFPVDGMFGATSPDTSYTCSIKVAAPLSWGVLLPLHKMENLSTPAANWDTMIPPRALPGTSAVFNKLLVWVIYCITIIHLVELFTETAPHQNSVPVSARRISVFMYQIA